MRMLASAASREQGEGRGGGEEDPRPSSSTDSRMKAYHALGLLASKSSLGFWNFLMSD